MNWAPWRKFALLLVVSLYAFVGNFQAADVAPALSTWYTTFTQPQDYQTFPTLVHLVAVNLLLTGASNIWWVPLAQILGRRPVLLVASLIMTLASVWAALADAHFPSLLAARMFQGIGAGPSETIAPAMIGEVYFVDERGRAMVLYTAMLALGSLASGVAGSYIAHQQGWEWIFWVSAIMSGALTLSIAFAVPETMFDRDDDNDEAAVITDTKTGVSLIEDASQTANTNTNTNTNRHRPYTYLRSLGFARPQTTHLLRPFLRPWQTLALPGTWVMMLHSAGLVGGIVTISTVGAQLVQQPPYNWDESNAGLINIGGLVGVCLSALLTYLTADARLRSRAKHAAHGFAEPESRLPTMFPSLAVATGGFYVFGFCAQYPGTNRWVGLEVGYGMLTFGLMQIPSVGFNYVSATVMSVLPVQIIYICIYSCVPSLEGKCSSTLGTFLGTRHNRLTKHHQQLIDSYSFLAGDCFVIVTILRSVIAFAWTFFVSDWINSRGAAEPFGIFGMLMGLFGLLTIPLWLFGKRMRLATAHVLDRSR